MVAYSPAAPRVIIQCTHNVMVVTKGFPAAPSDQSDEMYSGNSVSLFMVSSFTDRDKWDRDDRMSSAGKLSFFRTTHH